MRGSGRAATEVRQAAAFSALQLAGSSTMTVRVGEPRSVRVTADDNLLRHVTTRVRAGSLVVGTTGSFATTTPMSVLVTVPELDAVALSGSGRLVVAGLSARRLASAGELRATLSGSGDMQLQDLEARDVSARLTGYGDMRVHATRDLHASVSGTGSIRYSGDPVSVVDEVTGTGSVTAEP